MDGRWYIEPPGSRRARVTPLLRVEVADRYQRGETSREVAAACGVSKATALRILKIADVDVRPQGGLVLTWTPWRVRRIQLG